MFQHNPVLERWAFESTTTMSTTVLPDGCRDVIGRLELDGRTTWWLTDWVDTAYVMSGKPGQTWVGYRLQPGVCLREKELKRRIELMGDTPLSSPAPLKPSAYKSQPKTRSGRPHRPQSAPTASARATGSRWRQLAPRD
jgi:hypothetical protein